MRIGWTLCGGLSLFWIWSGCSGGGDDESRAARGGTGAAGGARDSSTDRGGSGASAGNLATGGASGSGTVGSAGSGGDLTGGTSGAAGSSGSTGGSATDASLPDVQFTYDGGAREAAACAATTVQAEVIPLDMHVMLDVSGSMLDLTQAGGTKWDAMKQAFISFVQDSQSDGLGVGIQYFAQRASGVPAQCTTSAQCGAAGPCVIQACANNLNIACERNSDCGPFTQCIPRGYCSNNAGYHCIPVGGTACGAGNQCLALTSSFCFAQDSCNVADYTTAAVPIAVLPGNRAALVSSINAQAPWSATPTSAALAGAVQHARGWATSHPTHRVAVLFATDGLPTRCDTNMANIAQLAAAGANGTPRVLTYVLGVFAAAEAQVAQQNLNQIAASGGSGTAFIVGTTGNVTQALIDALNRIRGAALACEYLMPRPEGGLPDPSQVKVIFVDGGGFKTPLLKVSGAGACGAGGGFYFDNATQPTRIFLCPQTCTTAQNVAGAKVEIELGCLGS